jgi:hypothetical protein
MPDGMRRGILGGSRTGGAGGGIARARCVWLGGLWFGGLWLGGPWTGGRRPGGLWLGGPWTGGRRPGGLWSGAPSSGALWSGALWSGALWTGGLWTGGLSPRGLWPGAVWSAGAGPPAGAAAHVAAVPAEIGAGPGAVRNQLIGGQGDAAQPAPFYLVVLLMVQV